MSNTLANDFTEILSTLSQNVTLRDKITDLVASQPIVGKVVEGGSRLAVFRLILTDLVNGNIDLDQAYIRTKIELSPQSSPHSSSKQVFASRWEVRLVHVQLSRFYNQAVMENLLAEGETQCFVPHSTEEDVNSPCSLQLAGSNHDLKTLYARLIESYAGGTWPKVVKIPDHPYCTHVVTRAK